MPNGDTTIMNISETLNAAYIDEQYRRWKSDPGSVSRDWQFFFEGFRRGAAAGAPAVELDNARLMKQARVQMLIDRYRNIGHLLACLDPLSACPTEHPLLNLAAFGLTLDDLGTEFCTPDLAGVERAPLKDIVALLRETYCRSVGVEYMHLQDPEERRWLRQRMEPVHNRPQMDTATRLRIITRLTESVLFEHFLNRKYAGQTRFSLEGADVVIAMLDALAEHSVAQGVGEIILGMAHRGRLNVQANILHKPLADIFAEFEVCYNPDSLTGAGDVKYHNGYLAETTTAASETLRWFLVNNPSHLESVDPVVEGVARARQELLPSGDAGHVLPLLIHGDAAFAGQGLVAETLNMSQLQGYRTGGTVHLIINNQIGYTTLPEDARSTRYSTDVAKMLMVPIFHVHGENPDAAVHVMRLAVEYRQTFGKDVVVDVVCYRRYGHNEGDEPYFTQPLMYERIRNRPPVSDFYARQLTEEGLIRSQDLERVAASIRERLEAAYEEVHGTACVFPAYDFYENWRSYQKTDLSLPADTRVPKSRLTDLAHRLAAVPEGFGLHPKLEKLLEKRLQAVRRGSGIDWANAEQLAFASLLADGTSVRLSGQDSQRGTFSQRHSVLVDTRDGSTYTPLNHLSADQAPFAVHNSLLAEASVLGFEYGYAMVRPEALVLWEAQFGDFVNNAQAVIDLYIASGEEKWQRFNGLVLLLPHGLEGLGPEHSSARPERFLQLCANDNLQVCNPTTPAQYFHLLRRQVLRPVRKPLVVLTPKSLLRHPQAVSELADLAGGGFRPILADGPAFDNAGTVILCSGKLFYELDRHRQMTENQETAIVRIEQLYPFPEKELRELAGGYPRARKWLWVQEEPENMGAWRFVRPLLESAGITPLYVGRPAAASPATGYPNRYRAEQQAILDQALGGVPDKSVA